MLTLDVRLCDAVSATCMYPTVRDNDTPVVEHRALRLAFWRRIEEKA